MSHQTPTPIPYKVFEVHLSGYSTLRGGWEHKIVLPATSEKDVRDTVYDHMQRLARWSDWEIKSIKEVPAVKECSA